MPHRTRTTGVLAITARLLLGITREFLEVYRNYQAPSDVEDLLICCAVIIGCVERRPMGAGKVAAYTGLPRSTVVRRVKRLVDSRYLHYSDDGKALLVETHQITGELAAKRAKQYIRLIQNAAGELTKMGN